MEIDAQLIGQFKRVGDGLVPVVITCSRNCHLVVKKLEELQIELTDTGSFQLGTISAKLSRTNLKAVTQIPGITAIEFDSLAELLDEDL